MKTILPFLVFFLFNLFDEGNSQDLNHKFELDFPLFIDSKPEFLHLLPKDFTFSLCPREMFYYDDSKILLSIFVFCWLYMLKLRILYVFLHQIY